MTRTIRLRTPTELAELRREVEERRNAPSPMLHVPGGGPADLSSLAEAVSSRTAARDFQGRRRRAFSVSREQQQARDAGDDLTI